MRQIDTENCHQVPVSEKPSDCIDDKPFHCLLRPIDKKALPSARIQLLANLSRQVVTEEAIPWICLGSIV